MINDTSNLIFREHPNIIIFKYGVFRQSIYAASDAIL